MVHAHKHQSNKRVGDAEAEALVHKNKTLRWKIWEEILERYKQKFRVWNTE
jgi:hypothetical protein